MYSVRRKQCEYNAKTFSDNVMRFQPLTISSSPSFSITYGVRVCTDTD